MTESWYELADRLTAVLNLEAPPIAITFSDDPPVGVPPPGPGFDPQRAHQPPPRPFRLPEGQILNPAAADDAKRPSRVKRWQRGSERVGGGSRTAPFLSQSGVLSGGVQPVRLHSGQL